MVPRPGGLGASNTALLTFPYSSTELERCHLLARSRLIARTDGLQWRNNGVAAAFSDGGPIGGRGPPTVLFYFKSERRGPDLRK